MKRATLLILLCPLLAGCGALMGAFSSGSLEEINREIAELRTLLESAKTPSETEEIEQKIETLEVKKEAIKKARDSAGSGAEGFLYFLGVVLGIPLLGTAGKVVGGIIRGSGKTA